MESIKVNCNCKIDTNYFAKSREDSLNVAINITSLEALKGNENKGFINFTFGFNKDDDVYENYTLKELEDDWITNIDGYGWYKLKKFDENNIFISKIKLLNYNDIDFDILKDLNEKIFKSKSYYVNNLYKMDYVKDITKITSFNGKFSNNFDTERFNKAVENNDMKYLPYKLKNLENDRLFYEECIILFGVYDINNELIAISYVYNIHNSWYTHIVEKNYNGDIEVIEYL
jgi:hypothetical protein